MKQSIFRMPIAYNYHKIFIDGYHYLTSDGKNYSLTLRDREIVEFISKTVNISRFRSRKAELRRISSKYKSPCRIEDGYATYDFASLPALDQALKFCDEKIKTYLAYKAAPGPITGVKNMASYETEMAKTQNDPLKHIPYSYDPVAAKALIAPFLCPEMYLPAANYIGTLPIISGVRILYSPNDDAPSLRNAQMFHVDPEGSRQAKVFIAIEDVGPENSPLTFLSETDTKMLTNSPDPAFSSKRVRDKSILQHVPHERWISHQGRRGNTLFIDTSRCLHYGSRPNKKPRFLLMAQYLDPFCSIFPVLGAQKGIRKRAPAFPTSDPTEQYLLGLR